jgi:hypothetical protein
MSNAMGADAGISFTAPSADRPPVCALNHLGAGVAAPMEGLLNLPEQAVLVGGSTIGGGDGAGPGPCMSKESEDAPTVTSLSRPDRHRRTTSCPLDAAEGCELATVEREKGTKEGRQVSVPGRGAARV